MADLSQLWDQGVLATLVELQPHVGAADDAHQVRWVINEVCLVDMLCPPLECFRRDTKAHMLVIKYPIKVMVILIQVAKSHLFSFPDGGIIYL